jgi:hypothetical protein
MMMRTRRRRALAQLATRERKACVCVCVCLGTHHLARPCASATRLRPRMRACQLSARRLHFSKLTLRSPQLRSPRPHGVASAGRGAHVHRQRWRGAALQPDARAARRRSTRRVTVTVAPGGARPRLVRLAALLRQRHPAAGAPRLRRAGAGPALARRQRRRQPAGRHVTCRSPRRRLGGAAGGVRRGSCRAARTAGGHLHGRSRHLVRAHATHTCARWSRVCQRSFRLRSPHAWPSVRAAGRTWSASARPRRQAA